jgi:aspartate kinase
MAMKNNKKIVVMKFGGTSVADPGKIMIVANHIKKRLKNGELVIAVISAMDKETDRIINMIHQISLKPNLREYDQVLHTGEIVSAGMLAIALLNLEVPAVSLTASQLGIETSADYSEAKIKKIKKIDFLLDTLEKNVVIIPGFQGLAEDTDNITTLGRGGSDATAVAIAGAVKADVCEIYTDVDGVYTIDPRLVHNAKRFKKISYMQMIAMAGAGAGVLMDRSVVIAQAHNIDIKVLLSPSFGESTGGTIVCSGGRSDDIEESIFLPGISIKKNIGLLNILNIPNKPNQASKIFNLLTDFNIQSAVQGKPNSKASISITLDGKDLEKAAEKLKKLPDITVEATNGLVSLSLIDPAMKDNSGYYTGITKALGETGVNINLLSSGETSIVITIDEINLKKAATALADEFKLTKQN